MILGFANQGYDGLMTPYVARYFDQVEDVWNRRTSELAQNMVVGPVPELGLGDRRRRRSPRPMSSWPAAACRPHCADWSAKAGPTWRGR